ncbi:ferritin-like domain-containing protein [Citreimonas salinaria]|uniref:Ferritin-like metal-binding protein YciE n=1 Tax=Citreimonas salinaria TaxID=321339 RepID=A0A1H3LSM8_9RHOB|nr:DUF892 family protein [Citreimonas salinaria]SDY67363.1 Ferritin-like metal-binding protein YciE [Citreimonas salinaria]
MATDKTLQDAFHDGLRDVLFAERASLRAQKKAARAAQMPELKEAFEHHAGESEEHKQRLEQVFEMIGKAARGKTCDSIQGLMAEFEDHIDEFKATEAADAVLIAGAQAKEHYEIARYGTLVTWAKQLGHDDAAKLLAQTLQEEKKTDDLLNKEAQKANKAAKQDWSGSHLRATPSPTPLHPSGEVAPETPTGSASHSGGLPAVRDLSQSGDFLEVQW